MAEKESPEHMQLVNLSMEGSSPQHSTPSTVGKAAGKSSSLLVSRFCRYHSKSSSLFDIKKYQVAASKQEVHVGDLMLAFEERRTSEPELAELSLLHLKTGSTFHINKQLLKFIPLNQLPNYMHEVINLGNISGLDYYWHTGPDLNTLAKSHSLFPLHYAAERSPAELVVWMLSRTNWKDLVDIFDSNGNSLLHAVCKSNNPESFKTCFDRYKEDNKVISDIIARPNNAYQTPLYIATQNNFQVAVETLLETGADPMTSGPGGLTPIHLAVQKGNMHLLHLLLRKADSNRSELKKLLGKSVSLENGDEIKIMELAPPEAISLLVQFGANPDSARRETHATPLFQAAHDQNIELIRVLLEAGANPNTQDKTGNMPLMEAIAVGSVDVVAILLDAGSSPNIPNNAGFNAVNQCAQYGHVEILDLLVRAGGQLVSDDMFTSALHSAAFWDEAEILRVMLTKYKVPVNTLSKINTLPVHPAIRKGHSSCLRVLIEEGANISFKSPLTGDTLLHLAVRENQREAVRLLVKARLNQDEFDNENLTPLMLAVQLNRHDLIPILFAAGASLEKRDMEGNTPLHIAATHSSLRSAKCILDLMQTLRDSNVDVCLFEEKNNKGETPFDISLNKPKESVSRLFVEYGNNEYLLKPPEADAPIKPGKRKFSRVTETLPIPINIFHRAMNNYRFKTMHVLQEKMVSYESQSVALTTSFLDFDELGFLPDNGLYNFRSKTILHKLLECAETEVKYHPLVNIVVSKKISIYRNWYLFSFLLYFVYLLFLSYALFQGATRCDPLYYLDTLDYLRLFSEVVVILYVICFFLSEIVEFWVDWYNILQEKSTKNQGNEPVKPEISTQVSSPTTNLDKIGNFVQASDKQSFYFLSALYSYFSDLYNFLDISAIVLVVIVFVLRLSGTRVQWIFASIMYIINTFRLFKYIRIIPALGAYSVIIFRIFLIDMPKFLAVFIIIFFAFYGGALLAIRFSPNAMPPISTLNENCSLTNPTTDPLNTNCTTIGLSFFGHTNVFRDLMIAGVLLLVDGGASGHEADILLEYSWYFETVYIVSAFIISVVLSNILIAQLTATYSQISVQNELHYKLELVVSLEHSSNIFFFCGTRPRRYCTFQRIVLPMQQWEDLTTESYSKTTEELLYDVTENLHEFRQEVGKDLEINLKSSSDLHAKVENIEEMSSLCLKNLSEITSHQETLSNGGISEKTSRTGIDEKLSGILSQSRSDMHQQMMYLRELESRMEERIQRLGNQLEERLKLLDERIQTLQH